MSVHGNRKESVDAFLDGRNHEKYHYFVALLGAAAIFTVLYCLIAAGSQAEKKLTEIMRKEEEQNEDK